jgi:putative FmdB family regulatory protein
MPVYEYQCQKCGEVEEVFQKISDLPRETCSHCEGTLKKIISQSTFHLKGSGWYVTDYGGSKKPGTAGTETKSEKKVTPKSKAPKTNSKKSTASK